MPKTSGIRAPPKSLAFNYPNRHRDTGTVVQEVRKRAMGRGGEYIFVIQEVEHEKSPTRGARGPWIRFGYYRREKGEKKYRWGSQTTFHANRGITEDLIRQAVKKGILRLDHRKKSKRAA